MKLKYTFKRIRSESPTIELRTNDVVIKQFNADDYGENYTALIDQSFGINPADCYDLEKLNIKGAEAHTTKYSDEVKEKWNAKAKYYLGTKHLNDTIHMSELPTDKPIKLINQDDWTVQRLLDIYGSKSPYGNALYDLSDFTVTETGMASIVKSTSTTGCRLHSFLRQNVTKPYSLKEDDSTSRINIGFGTYSNANNSLSPSNAWTTLKSTQNFLKNKVHNYTQAYIGCSSLETIDPSIEEATLYSAEQMFYNCNSLKELRVPKLVQNSVSQMYGSCNFTYVDWSGFNLASIYYNSPVCATCKVLVNTIDYIELNPNKYYGYNLGTSEKGLDLGVININGPVYFLNDSNYFSSRQSTDMVAVPYYYGLFDSSAIIKNIAAYPAAYSRYDYTRYANLKTSITGYVTLLKGNSGTWPNSDGFEWWVDYIAEDNDYIKTITEKTISANIDITTTKEEDIISKDFCFIKAKESYNHSFELSEILTCNIEAKQNTITNAKDVSVSVCEDDPTKITVTCTCTNITDDSITNLKMPVYIAYIAIIDGHEFHGYTKVNCDISYKFTIDEDIDVDVEIEDYTVESYNGFNYLRLNGENIFDELSTDNMYCLMDITYDGVNMLVPFSYSSMSAGHGNSAYFTVNGEDITVEFVNYQGYNGIPYACRVFNFDASKLSQLVFYKESDFVNKEETYELDSNLLSKDGKLVTFTKIHSNGNEKYSIAVYNYYNKTYVQKLLAEVDDDNNVLNYNNDSYQYTYLHIKAYENGNIEVSGDIDITKLTYFEIF